MIRGYPYPLKLPIDEPGTSTHGNPDLLATRPPGVIVLAGNEAFAFMKSHHADLFNDVPVVPTVVDVLSILVISYVPMKTPQVIDALGALAHEYRLAIFRLLVEQGTAGLPAGVIGERVGLAPSSLTFHLQALQRAGLVSQVRASRQIIYSADYSAMNELVAYLTDKCCTATGKSCEANCAPAPIKVSRRKKVA